jgi:pumilio family protein 6
MIMEFRSHVVRLLLHREASQTIADIFELHTNAAERAILLRDFYGREAALLPLPHKGDEATKDGRSVLSVVLQNASAEQRRRILASLSENLNLMLVYPLFRMPVLYPGLQVQQLRQGFCPTRNCPQGSMGVLVRCREF